MKSKALQTVTEAVPVLVPISELGVREEDADGWISVPRPRGHLLVSVCKVSRSSVPALKGESLRLGAALAALRESISLRDAAMMARAIESAGEWMVSPGMTMSYDFSDMRVSTLLPSARSNYSTLMSRAMLETRMVVWSPHNGTKPPMPGFFCPDIATAALTLEALNPSQVRLCADPACRIPFHPTNKGKRFHHPTCRVRAKRARDAKALNEASRSTPLTPKHKVQTKRPNMTP